MRVQDLPTRLLSKRQLELNAEAQKRVKVTPTTTVTPTVTPVEVKPRVQVKCPAEFKALVSLVWSPGFEMTQTFAWRFRLKSRELCGK